MSENSKYSISQDLEILPPKKGKVYPIPVSDWKLIKTKISEITFKINWLTNIGSILIGASLSFLGTNLTADFKTDKMQLVCWTLFASCFICGLAFIIFGELRRHDNSVKPEQVIRDMTAIESRYESDEQ